MANEEIDNEQHFTESVGAFHTIQHYDCWLRFARTGANRTAYNASRYSNSHVGANIYTSSCRHSAPNVRADGRSCSNLDAGSHASGDWHTHLDRPDRM